MNVVRSWFNLWLLSGLICGERGVALKAKYVNSGFMKIVSKMSFR